jgi:predicted RNA methylase
VLIKAGGKYNKNGFIFEEPAIDVYDRIIGGENYNLKKKYQFYDTKPDTADYIVSMAHIKKEHTILEPSAGRGALIFAINRIFPDKLVYCYEMMPINIKYLGKIHTACFLGENFLNDRAHTYDRIIANPPFSNNQDIDHLKKMYNRLNLGGKVVSVTSTHWQHSTGKKETEFRDWLGSKDYKVIYLPKDAFKGNGANVETRLIIINKHDNL